MSYIRVKVKTGTRKEIFRKEKEDLFSICVREKAERNEANERVLKLVALHFGVPLGKVKMIKGHHRPSKLISVGE